MATQTYLSNADHSTDAAFRAWVVELSNALVAAGLVQQADTGQINKTTVLKPSATVAAGYEIFRLNDTLNATRPILIKIEYGSGNSTTAPQIWITVGTGTNGAGSLTGSVTSRQTACSGTNPVSNTTSYNTYVSVANGGFNVSFKLGGVTGKGIGFFGFYRSTDDAGAMTGDWGCLVTHPLSTSGANRFEMINYSTNQTISFADGSSTYIPGTQTSSISGVDVQLYKHFLPTPRIRPLFGLYTVFTSEVSVGTTFSSIPIGATVSHTYISLGASHTGGSINQINNTCICMLWE